MPRSCTSGLRKSPPDCRFAGSVEAHRLLAGPEGGAKVQARVQGCTFRKRNILESVFRVEAAEQQLDIGRHFGRCSEASMTLSNGGRPAVSSRENRNALKHGRCTKKAQEWQKYFRFS